MATIIQSQLAAAVRQFSSALEQQVAPLGTFVDQKAAQLGDAAKQISVKLGDELSSTTSGIGCAGSCSSALDRPVSRMPFNGR